MSVAILVPSLNRGYRMRPLVTNIHAATTVPHKIYFCVSDDESKRELDALGEWYLDDSDSDDRRYVTRMNKLVRHIGDEETVFFGSDDVFHHLRWYEHAKSVMNQGYHLVVVNDMHNQNGTAALIHRDHIAHAVFDSPGDVFHAGYVHNFADNEQFYTAYLMGEYAKANASFVEHLHPVWGEANALPWDDTYHGARKGWDHDLALYETRSKLIEATLKRS